METKARGDTRKNGCGQGTDSHPETETDWTYVMPRTMREPLSRWLESLSASDRRVLLHVALEGGRSPLVDRLYAAIGVEIAADVEAERAMMHRLEVERLADLDARFPNPPAPEGRSVTHDPDTGTFTDD